jgi:hypothetical protein
MAAHSATTAIAILPELLSTRLPAALSLMANSLAYAKDVAGDPWDFAVSMVELSAVGVTLADCRWLSRKGFVEARAVPRSNNDSRRQTAAARAAAISPKTWFVLTSLGSEFLASFQRGEAPLAVATALDQAQAALAAAGPRWEADRRELWVGKVLVKRFRVPAENQEIVLAVFEELGWPECIDDPIPPKPGIDSKRRLHDTIKRLNRSQTPRSVVFAGNGNGSSIRWRRAP